MVGGLAVLPADLRGHLRKFGHVYWRVPYADSRVARFVLGQAGRGTDDFVPFEEVTRRYGDLAEDAEDALPPAPEDESLGRLLAAHPPEGGRGLVVGAGVGRGAFVLRTFLDLVLGVDRSAARVRRARNLAATRADFVIPAPPRAADAEASARRREARLDLDRLVRDRVDFAVADAERLPLADDAVQVAVLPDVDGRGVWADPVRALSEALRVLAPGGLLVRPRSAAAPMPSLEPFGADGPWAVYRRWR